MRGVAAESISRQAAVAASKSILSSATPGTSGGRAGSLSDAASRSQSSILFEPASRLNRRRHFRRTDQADERAAREFGRRTIVETATMALKRLALRLLADLLPNPAVSACALLLRQLENVRRRCRPTSVKSALTRQILEIFRLLLLAARRIGAHDKPADPLAKLRQGLPRSLHFLTAGPR